MGKPVVSNGVEDTALDKLEQWLTASGVSYNKMAVANQTWLHTAANGPFIVRYIFDHLGKFIKVLAVSTEYSERNNTF